MTKGSRVGAVVTAAVVLVILPLLITISTFGAHIVLEATGGAGLGMFDHVSGIHIVMLGWTVVAIAVVGALITALLARDIRQHA